MTDHHVDLPPVGERLRMALAEVGYPAAFNIDALTFKASAIPRPVMWRARETALLNAPICRCCWTVAAVTSVRDRAESHAIHRACQAVRRFEQDCGARPEEAER